MIDSSKPYPMIKGLKQLMSNRNYVILLITFNFVYGVYSALPSMLTQLTDPFFALRDPGLGSRFALVFLVSGLVASFIIGVVLDKFQNYKSMTIMLSSCTFIFSLVLFYSIRQIDNPLILTINLGLFGASIIPMLTVAFPFAVELTRPIPEGFSNGILITMGLLWGALLASVVILIPNDYAFGLFALCSFLAICIGFMINEDLRR